MHRILYTIFFLVSGGYASAQCNAVITPGGPTTFCEGNSVGLTGSPGDTYQWYLNGNSIPGATNSTHTADVAGSYTVETDSAGCVSMSDPVVVTVNTVPAQPGPISGNDTICGGAHTFTTTAVPGATGYAWEGLSSAITFGPPDTTTLPTVTGYITPPSGSFRIISVRAVNECGVSSPSQKQPTLVGAPELDGHWPGGQRDVADWQVRICPSQSYTLFPVLKDHGQPYVYIDPYKYQWCLDNIPIPGATNWEHVITQGGNYSVKIITDHCGTHTIQKKVYQDVPTSITISPSGPLSFCVGTTTPLTVSFDMTGVSDPITWTWTKNLYSHGMYNNFSSIMPDTSAYYAVTSKSSHHLGTNCQVNSSFVQVTIPPPLTVTQTDDTLFATPGYDSYQWFENGMPLPGETNQKLVLSVDGFYTVEGIFMNGCVESSNPFDSDFMPPPPPEPPGTNPQEELAEQMTVSPNPVSGSFVLKAKVAKEDTRATISITDATGSSMFEKEIDVVDGIVEEKIELGNAPALMGIIRLRSAHTLKTTTFFRK